jgi:hypothetical protein
MADRKGDAIVARDNMRRSVVIFRGGVPTHTLGAKSCAATIYGGGAALESS